ncbi:early growth response protein 1 isoform X1 [Platichthys flesus]|uniref:early growth response protein 1 isoform X1 n=1 Tax=Platichthys flesus TaxID=8260 RepID=UPI002DB82BB0|nr:early growth response protein 1 isoform X1 [Platichthys flesus]
MSNRLAFQTQLASIMEVLANAAVAEICKLVDDDYAVVSLQMSQCHRENKSLKRKLHLLELKMARGNAERRLRESSTNSTRPRVQINCGDRRRESSPSTGGVFERQMDITLWSDRTATRNTVSQANHSGNIQSMSPDLELVEPDAMLVKEEKVEANMSCNEETVDVPLIGDDGVLKCVHRGVSGERLRLEEQDTQIQISRTRPTGKNCNNSRGVEKDDEPDVVLVKVEEVEPLSESHNRTDLSIQEGLVESSTDDYRGGLPFDDTTQASTNQLLGLQESEEGFSESAEPQSTPMISEDSSSKVAVHQRVPDTKTSANPNAQPPAAHRSSNSLSLSSEYSLFEIETFFTRWAPDHDSVSTPSGPSCSFSIDDSVEFDIEGVTIVEAEPSVSPAVRISGGQSLSPAAGCSTVHIQPPGSQAGTSVSVPQRIQVPSSQHPWSRTPAMIKSAQSVKQQQHNNPSAQTTLTSSTAAAANSNSGDKTSVSGITSTCRIMSSTVASQSALALRGSPALLASIDLAIAAQQRASLLGHLSKSQPASIASGEHRRKGYVCQVCGKSFSGLSNLEAHERVHTGEKPFRCDTCGKYFSEAGNLKKHQRVHTGEKPFSCEQCGKSFAWICNLRTHQQSATGCGSQLS